MRRLKALRIGCTEDLQPEDVGDCGYTGELQPGNVDEIHKTRKLVPPECRLYKEGTTKHRQGGKKQDSLGKSMHFRGSSSVGGHQR